MICVADENQLMPDFARFGFAYVSPQKLAGVLGTVYYPQFHLLSGLEKTVLEDRLRAATGTTLLVTAKEEHIAYAGMQSEAEEGKTMGAVLPVLFLGIAVLTMVTTMHRIAANEKVQIGTLKALGFRDKRILRHYTSYAFMIGLIGTVIGLAFGYLGRLVHHESKRLHGNLPRYAALESVSAVVLYCSTDRNRRC